MRSAQPGSGAASRLSAVDAARYKKSAGERLQPDNGTTTIMNEPSGRGLTFRNWCSKPFCETVMNRIPRCTSRPGFARRKTGMQETDHKGIDFAG
jgi:hypothetical protein